MQKLIITGIVSVLVGSAAFSAYANSTEPATPLRQAQGEKTRRLTIAVSVAAMSDLKVTEGQTLQTGDTIDSEVPD
jgi:hypothetical protein